jgi:hypothetical protein
LTSLANEPTPDPVTPSLPSFNPDALLRSHALKPRTSEHEEPPAVTLPVFDPSMIHGRNTVESAPSLPTFDPELLRRKPESTSEGLPQFDPEQIKNSQRKLPD